MFDFPITLYSQFLVALLGVIIFIKKRTFFINLLVLFLLTTFLVELLGWYLPKVGKTNFEVYHFYTVFQYVVIFFLYKRLLKDRKYFRLSYLLLFFLLVFWILAFFEKIYLHYMGIIGSLNVGFMVFLFLRELLLSNEIVNYKRLLPFWVSVGLLVFHLPAIPFFSFWSYMKNRDLLPILYSLIVLMNVIISFGLIWSSKKVEY